ncbi:MAG: aminotransferase class V-fold PLP-dependent enzyme, partial [Alistipes sp.]|nr:aminotransferase class V-fold PLP-dependent enzyme [Alistipes sp.]
MIYLDYAASCVPFAEAAELSCRLSMSHYASPGALHTPGDLARGILNESRKTMAQLLQVRDREVFFTSGGTEA